MAGPDKPTWVELLDERTPHLIKELVPTKLLPYLNLPKSDKENIECDEKNKGKQIATVTLFSRLTKRNGPNGQKTFEQLVRALRNVGNQQSALLLDPNFKGNYYVSLYLTVNTDSYCNQQKSTKSTMSRSVQWLNFHKPFWCDTTDLPGNRDVKTESGV